MHPAENLLVFERDALASRAALRAVFEDSAATGATRLRNLRDRIDEPAWPGVTPASALRSAATEAEVTAILSDYARDAGPVIDAETAHYWQSLVRAAQHQGGAGPLADELSLSTVGAALLREQLGARPPKFLRPSNCACGYAVDGVLPEKICPEIADALLRRWVAEERRLLRAHPEVADAVGAVLTRTAKRQETAIARGGEYQFSDARARRRSGGRQLRRLGRTHRRLLAELDLARWASFVPILSRDARPAVQGTAATAGRWGLGAAGLTELAVLGIRQGDRLAGQHRANGSRKRSAP